MADGIIAGFDGLRSLVAAVKAKIAAYVEYRRTVDVLTTMTDRELDDIGISRGDIPAVARGVDPRPQAAERIPADALARRLALAEAFAPDRQNVLSGKRCSGGVGAGGLSLLKKQIRQQSTTQAAT